MVVSLLYTVKLSDFIGFTEKKTVLVSEFV